MQVNLEMCFTSEHVRPLFFFFFLWGSSTYCGKNIAVLLLGRVSLAESYINGGNANLLMIFGDRSPRGSLPADSRGESAPKWPRSNAGGVAGALPAGHHGCISFLCST